MRAMIESGELALLGTLGTDWVGIPLKVEGEAIGVLVLQTYEKDQGYTDEDVDLLNFVGQYGQRQWGPTFASVCIAVFPTLAIYILLNQKVMKGLTAGSLKG